MRKRRYVVRVTHCASLALVAVLTGGCATLGNISWSDVADALKPKPKPPVEAAYVVREGDAVCRDLTVPAWLEFTMTNKQPGTPEREEVVAWGVSVGGDFNGGNPTDPAVFSFRAHDSRPTWGKLKTHGAGQGYVGEPPLRMAWAPAESYSLRFAVDAGEVSWTAKRASDGATAEARQAAQAPPKVTICIGDPRTRKAALGASYTGIKWSDDK